MQAATGQVTSVVGGDDAGALRRAQSGDAVAFRAIVSERLEGAFRFACAILGSEVEAADATEHAFVAAWHELPRLEELEQFDTWLRRILLNECRMQLRARPSTTVMPYVEQAADPTGETAVGPWDLGRLAAINLLEGAFEGLDAEDRAVLVLHYLEDRPLADIAGSLHMPPGTVKWRLHEAREALLKALESGA